MKSGVLKLWEDHGYGPYAMVRRSDGTRIGICGLFKRENLEHPDIGFAALPEYYGKGYTVEAARAVMDWAVGELGLEH